MKLKYLLIPASVLLVVGLAVILIRLNKPHRKAENETGIALTAQVLYANYKVNEKAANAQYLNKVVEVSGEIVSQEKNQDGQSVAVLRGEPGDDLLGGGVMCTLRDKSAAIPAGSTVTLKGFCTGFANDVHLTDCIVKEK